jgi:hypothetical protein
LGLFVWDYNLARLYNLTYFELTRSSKYIQLGFLQPPAMERVQHRITLYADNVIMSLWPNTNDHYLIKELLGILSQVSGLVTNIAKTSVSPIQC